MNRRWLAGVAGGAALTVAGVLGLSGGGPVASAAGTPPVFANGFGLTVVSQPEWVDEHERTFVVTVRSTEVPEYSVLDGQVSGEHAIMVTLPEGYDGNADVRYPVQYHLHGHPDRPNTVANQQMFEESTAGVPLITVAPNGSGRGWYSNWTNPPASIGKQNWENFHLDQVIPFVDANLATIPERAGRAISGHSMGGFGAFHYAEHRPELFAYVGSFSGGLDLLSQEQRAAVVSTTQLPSSGDPTVPADAIFGPPVWPLDTVWNEQSPAQHVAPLRGMGVAMYSGNGGDLTVNPVQAVIENRALATNQVTSGFLDREGIPHTFIDYGDGGGWAEGCTGKHAQLPCLKADMNHFVSLLLDTLDHP